MDSYKNILAENIQRLAVQKGIGKTEACVASGAGKSFISNMIGKDQAPSFDKVLQLAQYFDVSIDFLVGYDKYSAEDTVKTYLFGTTNVDDDIFNQVKQYAKFIYQEKTSAHIAASGGGKISVSSSKKTKEELDKLEIVQNSRKEADEIKKKLKK